MPRVKTLWSLFDFYRRKNGHRDRLREFAFEIPARRIAIVRKQCVDALGGLLGLHWVDAIFGLVAFFVDGQDAKRGDGFKRIAGFRMHHANANKCRIPDINEYNHQCECD